MTGAGMDAAATALLGYIPNGPRPGLDRDRAELGGLVHRLEAAQWRSPAQISARQFEAVVRLAEHMNRTSALFGNHLAAAGLVPQELGTPEGLQRLPPLTRRNLQKSPDEVFSGAVPAAYGNIVLAASSGSTGEPVQVRRTRYDLLIHQAMSLRLNLWHGLGTGLRLCMSRAEVDEITRTPHWSTAPGLFWPTGPMLTIPNQHSIAEQARMIAAFRPDILLIYPSNIVALAQHFDAAGTSPFPLRQIRTISETLSDEDRALIHQAWGCPVVDVYSSSEVGYIAMQCPQSDLHHIMAETVLVEVIDDAGQPCAQGEIGRIVLTDLNNYATPLIRYAIGDLAEVGPPCPCGRGLPTLRRIAGRERNLVTMPDGSRHWPLTGRSRYRAVAPVVQYQMRQTDRDRIEVRLVLERPLTGTEEAKLREIMQSALGHTFALDFRIYQDRLPLGANGKFEEFVNLTDHDGNPATPPPARP